MQTTKTVPNFDEVQNGATWVGGPTHELQRQHIPGYQGHIKGLIAQNIYGKNFARSTSECINERHEKGITPSIDAKFTTTYKQQFGQPDNRKKQFINTAQSLLNKYQRQQHYINQKIKNDYDKLPKNIQQVPPIDRMHVVGYMGHKAVFRPPRKEIKTPPQPIQVKIPEKQVLEQMLKTGRIEENVFLKQQKPQPVVGYTGFLKGVKAQNQYAQDYQQLASNSIRR